MGRSISRRRRRGSASRSPSRGSRRAHRQRSPSRRSSRRRRRSRSRLPRRDSRSTRRSRRRSRSRSGRRRRSSRSPSRGRGKTSGVNNIPLGRRSRSRSRRHDSRSRSRSRRRSRSRSRSRSRRRSISPDRVRLWVPNNDCARIIGKGGLQLKEIEEEAKVSLRIQREAEMKRLGVSERYVDIRGDSPARQKAKEKILGIADFVKDSDGFVLKGDDKDEGTTVLRILRDEVGRILGRRGELIRDMEYETRARIDVDRRTGKVRIAGNSEQRKKAEDKIMEEVSFCEDEGGKVLKDGAENDQDCLRMYVLDSEAGRVIGRGGETVKEIMDKSDTQVKVQKNESRDAISNERLIQIYGDEDSRTKAMDLILEEVTFAKDNVGDIIKNTGNHNIEPGLAHMRRISKGAWICGFCSGDHKTRECPSREMNAQAMMQMQLLAGMAPMVPGMPVVPVPPTFPSMPIMHVNQNEVDEVDAALKEYEREDDEEPSASRSRHDADRSSEHSTDIDNEDL